MISTTSLPFGNNLRVCYANRVIGRVNIQRQKPNLSVPISRSYESLAFGTLVCCSPLRDQNTSIRNYIENNDQNYQVIQHSRPAPSYFIDLTFSFRPRKNASWQSLKHIPKDPQTNKETSNHLPTYCDSE